MWTIQSKILEIPGAKFNGKKKLGYTSRGCPLFWKIWKILFHSLLKVAENSNRTFWLNCKAPKVRPMGPYDHICAKKKWRKFPKVLRCKILCLPFFGDNNVLFFNWNKTKMRHTVFSRQALIQNWPYRRGTLRKERERLIEVGGALFKFSFQRIVTLLWLNLSKKNKNCYCNIIHVLTFSWTFVKTWLVIKPTVVTLITHFSHRCIGTARNRLSHQ